MSIGRSVVRKEGRAKVTGQSRYVDDLSLPGMLHGVTVRSAVPRGLIRQIHYGDGIPWDEITVVTAADIPGTNVVALITDDQPYLAEARVIAVGAVACFLRIRIGPSRRELVAASPSKSIRCPRCSHSRIPCGALKSSGVPTTSSNRMRLSAVTSMQHSRLRT